MTPTEHDERLRRWQEVALALDQENQTLKSELHWMPDPAPSFVTARVVADAGGVYARAVLLSVGPHHPVAKGQIALDDRGLVGRVTEVGARSARVLLITDINMPDINGLELINFVKKNPNYRDTPLFVITTEGRDQDRERGLALGAAEYLVKPFAPESLEGLVRRYLKIA